MTLTVGRSGAASAVTLLLKNPVLREYETCLDLSTGIVTIGDGISRWNELRTMHPLGMSTKSGSIPSLAAPRLVPGIYLCHDTVTIPCVLGDPITNSKRTGYSIFVHDKDGNEVYHRLVSTEDEISDIVLDRSYIPTVNDVTYFSVHCKSFGLGDGGSDYSGTSNSVLLILVPSADIKFAFINDIRVSLDSGLTILFDDVVYTGTETDLSTVIDITDTDGNVTSTYGTMSEIVLDPLPRGVYTYVVRVVSHDIVVSTHAGSFSVPSMTVPVVQSFMSGSSVLSAMTEFPLSPYISDSITQVTLITTTGGVSSELVVPLSHAYSINVAAGSTVSLAIKFDFAIYPVSYITNSTDITVDASKESTHLTASSGTWSVPDKWFEHVVGDTIVVDILAIGCGGDGNNSTSEFTYGTAGGGGGCGWVKSVTLARGVQYPFTVGDRDIISNGISSFADLLIAHPGETGVPGGHVTRPARGGTFSINTHSPLFTDGVTTYGGGNGGTGGGNGIKAGGGGGAGGPYGTGGHGGTEDIIFYKTSGGQGGAGGSPRCGGGGTGVQTGLSGLLSGAAGHNGTNGLVYIQGSQRPDGGEFGGGGAGANSLSSPGHGGRGTVFIQRSST